MAFEDGHGSEDEAVLRNASLESGSEEDLEFVDATLAMDSLSIRIQRKQIRQELTDPYNRLHSLALDADFVQAVSQVYPDFAVVANLRCGQWYVDPNGRQTVNRDIYFKSMDGHIGEWQFSLRRPNLGLLPILRDYGGAILVDSTRRGKSFPDALSKTVPIWCSVVNRAMCLRYSNKQWSEEQLDLYVAANISKSERAQIQERLHDWAVALAASTYTLPDLSKPLRPLHLSPASTLSVNPLLKSDFQAFYPVICCSASRCTTGGSAERLGSLNYVPGSGDDHEGWAPRGFSPLTFWKHREAILQASRADLPALLSELASAEAVASSAKNAGSSSLTWIGGTSLAIADSLPPTPNVFCVSVTSGTFDEPLAPNCMLLPTPQGSKAHLRPFSEDLPRIASKVASALDQGYKIVIVLAPGSGKNGQDAGVGLALALLALYYDESQQHSQEKVVISKASISTRLQWIIASTDGRFNPSRDILKRVNSFLFG